MGFILSMYYCAQGFLHLDFDLAELVTKLNPSPEYVIHSFEEKDFHKIGEEGAFAACFCFLEGGFMESDRLFGKLTKEYGVGADKIMLAGSFDSKFCAPLFRRNNNIFRQTSLQTEENILK